MADNRTQLETVIQTAIGSELKELHTALPGVVQSFDTATQLADIQLTIQRKLSGQFVNLPLLVGVPVRFQKSTSYSITFPIVPGDHVLVIFAERSIDNWLLEGGVKPPQDIRRHSLSDAFAIPMMYDQNDVIPSFNSSDLEIKSNNGNTKITIDTAGTVTITGDLVVNGVDFLTHTHGAGTYQDAEARPLTGSSGVPE